MLRPVLDLALYKLCLCIIHIIYVCFRACDNNDNIRYVDNPLSIDRPGIGVNIIYMAMEGVLFIALTLLLEVRLF